MALLQGATHQAEGTTLILGVVGLICSVGFILVKMGAISLTGNLGQYVADSNAIWAFLGFTLILSLNSLASTVGVFGTK